jgi:hypothetical protein
METHEPANNQSDVAASADRDNLAKEGIRKFNETVTVAFRNQDAAAMAALWTEKARVLPLRSGNDYRPRRCSSFLAERVRSRCLRPGSGKPGDQIAGRLSGLRDRPEYCASANGGRLEHRHSGEVLVHLPPRGRWRLARRCGHLQFNK